MLISEVKVQTLTKERQFKLIKKLNKTTRGDNHTRVLKYKADNLLIHIIL